MADHADIAAGLPTPAEGSGIFTIDDLDDDDDEDDQEHEEEEFDNEDDGGEESDSLAPPVPLESETSPPRSGRREGVSSSPSIRLRPKPPPKPRPNTIPVVTPYRSSNISLGGGAQHGSSSPPAHLSDGIECHTPVEFDESPGGLGAVEVTITECPRDLEEGETLRVDLGDGSILVTQALYGGVEAGDTFTAPYRIYEREEARPMGSHLHRPRHRQPRRDIHWNAGLCSCCDHGPCHPSFIGAVLPCCSCFLLSQVMTRLNLNSCGCRCGAPSRSRSTFEVLFVKFALYYIIRIGILYVTWSNGSRGSSTEKEWNASSNEGDEPEVPFIGDWRKVGFVIDGIFWFYVLCLLVRARVAIRERYLIPGSKVWDFISSALLFPCVLSQAARQTADYTSNSARWCTDTGLEERYDSEYGLEDPVLPLQPLRSVSVEDRELL
uniref:Uncharacterized protein n=1 Tax=Odontella aurita TaxID=265563 RepID=A0A7S4MN35_9STRA|mmetsp:Transcript_26453/g.78258  ORF Transcript_26453/g.78258 Transcript_26453/m.78258 type:complete len:437 (+) Transcript_26453:24-1334(+)